MSEAPKLSLYRRLTSSVPIMVTVLVHAVVVGIAGYLVTETIIGKKKTFEEAPPADTSFKKQVEHRLQVARKSGGSTSSPVSAQRIVSTATDALQLPEMPELPKVGASSLNGIGFGAGMGSVGAGSGYNTGLGGGSGTGAGFMSMSFLGVTNQRVSKVVFAVDVSLDIMDIKKGGFQAFNIIREQIMRLISTLSPATEFDVVLFERSNIRLFTEDLTPGSVENKTRFFEWMKTVNSNMNNLGASSAKGSIPWRKVVPPNVGIDPDYRPGWWVSPVHAALQLKPEVIFLITGSAGTGHIEISDSEWEKRKLAAEKTDRETLIELKKAKLEPDAMLKARGDAFAKARADLNAINKKQEAKGKDPFIYADQRRLADTDFQAAVRKAGYPEFRLDTTGWSYPDGKPIWWHWSALNRLSGANWDDAQKYISRLQSAFLRQTASVNIFYFVGPDFKPDNASENFTKTARRYNGKFEVLTTERLKQIQEAADKAAAK